MSPLLIVLVALLLVAAATGLILTLTSRMMPRWKKALILFAALAVCWFAVEQLPFLVGYYGYSRLRLGMSEEEITSIVGFLPSNYRRSRHIGGITSPGSIEVLCLQEGIPFSPNPAMRQWWERAYAIDVAFDANGRAVGIYLMKLRAVNW